MQYFYGSIGECSVLISLSEAIETVSPDLRLPSQPVQLTLDVYSFPICRGEEAELARVAGYIATVIRISSNEVRRTVELRG